MRLLVISDTHFFYHRDGGDSFIDSLPSAGIDVLIIAGDMGEQDQIDKPLARLCKKYLMIIRVLGNHEYWHSDRKSILTLERDREKKYASYHLLQNQVLETHGKRFIGSTLWFPEPHHLSFHEWTDFKNSPDLIKWVFEENKESRKFLSSNTQRGDIVITHHLPSYKCVSPKFKGSASNAFFVSDMEDVIHEEKPALWIHGHTHTPVDIVIDETRVICNPLGYIGRETTGFKDLIVDV